MRNLKVIAGAALMLATVSATPVFAAPAIDMSGRWTAGYVSSDGADVNTFDIDLKTVGAGFQGTASEVNTFGDVSLVMFLTSTISGSMRSDGSVEFVKTYDGSGDVSHSVKYKGQLDATRRRIRGTYDAGGASGAFEMVR